MRGQAGHEFCPCEFQSLEFCFLTKNVSYLQICLVGLGCTTVSINPKFRTPSWRPFRAAMFMAMGLSAVFPVLHGISMYGVAQMLDSIGLFWLVLQGFLYVSGAGLYAVSSPCPPPPSQNFRRFCMARSSRWNRHRLESRRSGILDTSMSGGARIRSSMCLFCWRRWRI